MTHANEECTQVENMEELIGDLLPETQRENWSISYLKGLLESIKKESFKRLSSLREIANRVRHEEFSIKESTDVGFLLRECEKHLDEMRKDFKAHKEMVGKSICSRLSAKEEFDCRGTLATSTLKVKYTAKEPHPVKEPEKFAKLCEFFDIDIDEVPKGMLRFHWPTVKKYVTGCMEMGIELPDELSDVNVELEVTYRSLTNGKGI